MRLAHFSDTHLGHMRYNKVVQATGVNQREQDVYDAFGRAVDGILSLEPDIVIHTGDLFDSPRPANRALYHAVRQTRRLVDAGIPLVLISGNHSTPRLRATGSLFALMQEFFPNVHAVHASAYEKVVVKGVAFHAVPHCFSQEELVAEVARIQPDASARFNVAMLHVGIEGFREFQFRTGEANEQILDVAQLPKGMDYTALGHYHKHVQVDPPAWYAGSTERLSIREANETKGFCVVDLDDPIPRFHEIAVRPMMDLEEIQAADMDALDLADRIEKRLRERPLDEAVVRLRVRNAPPATQANLDMRPIREMAASAFYFHLHWMRGEAGSDGEISAEDRAFKPVEEEWRLFMESADVHGRERGPLTALGLEYLNTVPVGEDVDAADLFAG